MKLQITALVSRGSYSDLPEPKMTPEDRRYLNSSEEDLIYVHIYDNGKDYGESHRVHPKTLEPNEKNISLINDRIDSLRRASKFTSRQQVIIKPFIDYLLEVKKLMKKELPKGLTSLKKELTREELEAERINQYFKQNETSRNPSSKRR